MSGTVPEATAFLSQPGYVARLTHRDGRATEAALAGETLFTPGARLDGALVEATYALSQPPLLKRLGDDRVPRIFDPQSVRFVGNNFTETEKLKALPYAPAGRITALNFDGQSATDLARGALNFAQSAGADIYIAPGLPLFNDDLHKWVDHNSRILQATVALNGSSNIDRKPLLALVAPGPKALDNPERVVNALLDYPIDGIYLLPLNLAPTSDSLEKLARFVQFVGALRDAGFPVMVGRVGAFGLVLQALGVSLFDSGLGQAESNNLAALNRVVSEKEKARRAAGKGGGIANRTYLEPLKTTLKTSTAAAILQQHELTPQFTCNRGCCRFHTPADLPDRARAHYLWTRREEVDTIRDLAVPAMRLHHVESRVREARDLAARVRREFPTLPDLPSFSHLETWLGLLAREQSLARA